MNLTFVAKLDLFTRPTNIGVQKIDGSTLKTYGMVIARFLIQDKLDNIQLFEETFLLADTRMEIVLRWSFLALSNANIKFHIENFI